MEYFNEADIVSDVIPVYCFIKNTCTYIFSTSFCSNNHESQQKINRLTGNRTGRQIAIDKFDHREAYYQ